MLQHIVKSRSFAQWRFPRRLQVLVVGCKELFQHLSWLGTLHHWHEHRQRALYHKHMQVELPRPIQRLIIILVRYVMPKERENLSSNVEIVQLEWWRAIQCKVYDEFKTICHKSLKPWLKPTHLTCLVGINSSKREERQQRTNLVSQIKRHDEKRNNWQRIILYTFRSAI